MDNPNRTSLQNLYEGAYLLTRGFKLVGKQRQSNKVTITFEGINVQQEALKFYNGAKVDAKAYADSYRTLKDYIFER